MLGLRSLLERHQIALYVGAIAIGAVAGLGMPGIQPALRSGITPALMLLLFATFLSIPSTEIGRAFGDRRFLATVLFVNFVVVPAVAYLLSRFVTGDPALLLGVLLVLLTPCVDYVIVFTGLAGGSRERLLAATPLLMVMQLVLLPGYLWVFVGPETSGLIEVAPFVEAFLLLIVVPLAAATLVQWVARHGGTPKGGLGAVSRTIMRAMDMAMVPLMMLALSVVVGSQIVDVSTQLGRLATVIPLFIAFAAVMLGVGIAAGRLARIDPAGIRALVFSGTTRNSLVVLPLALALPQAFALTPLVVVTQMLVELGVMVAFVRVVPRLVPPPVPATPPR